MLYALRLVVKKVELTGGPSGPGNIGSLCCHGN